MLAKRRNSVMFLLALATVLTCGPVEAQPLRTGPAETNLSRDLLPALRQARPELAPPDFLAAWRSAGDLMSRGASLDVVRDVVPRNRSIFDTDRRYQIIVGGESLPNVVGRPRSFGPLTTVPNQTPFIVGGTDSFDESTLRVEVVRPDGLRETCSASLVSPRAVVTAIHCLCRFTANNPPQLRMTAYRRATNVQGTVEWQPVDLLTVNGWPTYPGRDGVLRICANLPLPPTVPDPPWHKRDAFRQQGDLVVFQIPLGRLAGVQQAFGVVPRERFTQFVTRPGPGKPGFGLGRIVGWGSVLASGAAGPIDRNEGSVATFACDDSDDEARFGCVPGREILVARFGVANDPGIIRIGNDSAPCRGDSGGPLQLLPAERWQEIAGKPADEQARLIGVAERWVAGVTSRRILQIASADVCGDGGVYAGFSEEVINVLRQLDTNVWRLGQ